MPGIHSVNFVRSFQLIAFNICDNQSVSLVVQTLLSVLEVGGLNPSSVKSGTVVPMVCHRCNVSLKLYYPGAKLRR